MRIYFCIYYFRLEFDKQSWHKMFYKKNLKLFLINFTHLEKLLKLFNYKLKLFNYIFNIFLMLLFYMKLLNTIYYTLTPPTTGKVICV